MLSFEILRIDPAPYIRRASESNAAADIRQAAAAGEEGINPRDVEMCLDADRFDFTLEALMDDGLLVLRKYEI